MTAMTDAPVFTVARNREMIQRAIERTRNEEREKIAFALDVQANTIGGVIGAALRQVADDVRGGRAIAPVVRSAEARRDLHHDDGTDPPLSVPFEALTLAQRQRRLARHAAEMEAAAQKIAADARADEERIERERAERKARGETADDSITESVSELPPVQFTSDDDDFHLAQRKL